MSKFIKVLPIIFAILMISIGLADLSRPESFRAAMDQINMPHYILWILGFAKVAGGLTIWFAPWAWMKEWAFAGFVFWAAGGISAHIFSGHGVKETAPLLGLSVFLILAYFSYKRSRSPSHDK